MTSDILVTLTEVTKKYGNRDVLTDISLTIRQGDCIILRGSNGSGKSTLLRIVCGLIPLTSGQRSLKHPKLVIGYTPDRLSKLRMTSTEYLTHMGKISNMPKKGLPARIKELHAFFNLEQSHSLKMTHFSKGMLQKVNLMQAMIKTPDLLVMDEPFSGLDKESTKHLLASLKKIKADGGPFWLLSMNPVMESYAFSAAFLFIVAAVLCYILVDIETSNQEPVTVLHSGSIFKLYSAKLLYSWIFTVPLALYAVLFPAIFWLCYSCLCSSINEGWIHHSLKSLYFVKMLGSSLRLVRRKLHHLQRAVRFFSPYT